MKARPRRVENQVAKIISEYLSQYDLPEVERIPVLGRTGPDISLWPFFKVAVDVKSRKANPKGYKVYQNDYGIKEWMGYEDEEHGNTEHMVGCRLHDLDLLFDTENETHTWGPSSKTVTNWLNHMGEWCIEPCRSPSFYIPALVLHWPGTAVKNSTFVIYKKDRRILHARRERLNNLRLRTGDEQRDDASPYWVEGINSERGAGEL